MKQYNEYKDSGIEWLGQIPAHWEVVKLKYELNNLNHIRVPLSSTQRGDMKVKQYDYYGASGVIDKVDDYLFDGENILIGEDGANLLTRSKTLAFIAKGQYWVNNHAHILHPKKGCIKYFQALLESLDYTPLIVGSAQPKLTQDALMNIFIVVPPQKEQEKIAEFLDHQTQVIDALVAKKKALIEKLQLQRQAIINEAVTKGLHSDAPMKDSGIEWLGEIPAHWEVSKIKYHLSLKGRLGWKGLKADEYVESGYGFLSTPDIKDNVINYSKINFITEERYNESPEIMLENEDVLLVKDGSTLGITNIIKELPFPCTVNSSIGILRIMNKETLLSDYLLYLLRTSFIQNVVNLLKAGQGVPHLFQKDIKNFDLLIPPYDEQVSIAAEVEKNTKLINTGIHKLTQQIEKLKTYRQTIISEAVTGKVDVSGWAG